MPEIKFTIDQETGKLEVHVTGIRGPTCGDVAKLVEEFLGKPALDHNTADFYVKPQIRPQVQPRRSK